MSDSSEFVDYDPVTRPRKTRVGAESVEDHWALRKNNEYGTLDFGRQDEPNRTYRREESSPPRQYEKASAIGTLKPQRSRGHAASFLGLFLFTLVLCFRPYEFSSALSWMT